MNIKHKVTLAVFLISFQVLRAQEQPWKWQSALDYQPFVLEEDTIAYPPTWERSTKWWEVFGYEKLNELEALALQENYDIKILKNRVAESRAGVKAAASPLFPSLSFNPSFIRQEFSGNRPVGFDVEVPQIRLNTYSLPVDLNYELDIFGRIRNNINAFKYNLQATEASRDNLVLLVSSEVARNFFQLITLDTENAILERTYRTRQDNLEIVEIRYQAGLVNEIDLQRARTELASIEVQLRNNEQLRTEIEIALATLCGQSPSEFLIGETSIKYLPPEIQPEEQERLKQSRPDLVEANFQLLSFEESLKNSRKQLYPTLSLQGSYGYLSGESNDIFESNSRTWLVGGTFSVPIFEGFRRKANLEISRQQLEASRNVLTLRELQANREVENALSNLSRLKEQLVAQQNFQEAAKKAAELSKERYTKGLVTYLEVVDAERIFLDAERLSAQLLGQQLINTVLLIQALGY